eukprot:GHVT01043826.1.p1 GENE.GHVT01043826.1~~GHVT01043826.1.p1  ORF type:complete len:231 (-),score=41.51 GHVT01043826.1:683-1375(-)
MRFTEDEARQLVCDNISADLANKLEKYEGVLAKLFYTKLSRPHPDFEKMTVEHKSVYSIFSEKDLSSIGDFQEYSLTNDEQLPGGIVPERYAFLVEQLLVKRAELVSKGVPNTGEYDVSVLPSAQSCIKVVNRKTKETFSLDWKEFDSVAIALATGGPKVEKFLAMCQTLHKIKHELGCQKLKTKEEIGNLLRPPIWGGGPKILIFSRRTLCPPRCVVPPPPSRLLRPPF